VEEAGLFMAFGVNPLWLLITRFVAATLAVHALRGVQYFRRRLLPG